ncbi:SDR family NAD(P)-dependent oxidoreductase [Streptomyces prunicolor]
MVSVGAVSARVPPPFFGPIAASKAALAALTHSLRAELRHQGVKVTLVEPGAMDTPIFATAALGVTAEAFDRIPLKEPSAARPR